MIKREPLCDSNFILPHDLFGFDIVRPYALFLLGISTLEASKIVLQAMAPKMYFTGAVKMLGTPGTRKRRFCVY
jgi:hypothetical protein